VVDSGITMAEGNGDDGTSNTPEINLNVDPTAFVDDVYNAVRWTVGWNDNDFEHLFFCFFMDSLVIICSICLFLYIYQHRWSCTARLALKN
jgi:hypothetical protein